MAARHTDEDESAAPEADRKLEGRIARRVMLARLALFWERLWHGLWPLPAVVGIGLGLALLELPQSLPHALHVALLAGWIVLIVALLVRGGLRARWPDRAAAERRVERASGLSHRPLEALRDRPASGDGAAAELWRLHLAQTAARLARIRSGWPRAGLIVCDPAAIRAATALLLVLALVIAGETAPGRLRAAFLPGIGPLGGPPPVVDLWVEPPAYTGAPPLYAQPGRDRLTFPAGSIVASRVRGGSSPPELMVDKNTVKFGVVERGTFEVRHPVAAGTRLAVRRGGGELAAWQIQVVPDHPPTATLLRPPSATQRAALRIDYAAEDDYGLASVIVEIKRTDKPREPVLQLPLISGEGQPRRLRGSDYRDLAAHPWAGQPVELRIVAKDAAGQVGASDPVRLTLPERTFHNPVARLIIDTRKRLEDTSEARTDVEMRLGAIQALTPLYNEDTTVFLGLASARARLRHNGEPEAVDQVRQLLWDLALRLEEGNLSIAEKDMRDAQRALADAINRNAPQKEIDQAMQRLREAFARYMQEMLARAQDQPLEAMEIPPDARVIEPQDIADMMRRLQEAMRSGDRQAAERALAELQQMLEALRNARVMRGMDPRQRGMAGMMRQLDDLAQRQQRLLDQTFREQQQREGQPGESGRSGELQQMQEALRRALGEAMRQLGERTGKIPGQLGRAEQAMRDAIEALGQDRPGDATGPQADALDQLRQAGRAMSRDIARTMGRGDPSSLNPLRDEETPSRDPFGRATGGYTSDTQDVGIPTESEFQRAREIRDELRRRAGDRSRPENERDYLERLLKSF